MGHISYLLHSSYLLGNSLIMGLGELIGFYLLSISVLRGERYQDVLNHLLGCNCPLADDLVKQERDNLWSYVPTLSCDIITTEDNAYGQG